MAWYGTAGYKIMLGVVDQCWWMGPRYPNGSVTWDTHASWVRRTHTGGTQAAHRRTHARAHTGTDARRHTGTQAHRHTGTHAYTQAHAHTRTQTLTGAQVRRLCAGAPAQAQCSLAA